MPTQKQTTTNNQWVIGIVGLGYVGLPLACAFSKKYRVIGFDVSKEKIEQLKQGIDPTNEIENVSAYKIEYSNDPTVLKKANFIIVAVPTPVDQNNLPDLKYVISASEIIGKQLQKGSIVVFESTVYPGTTEEICLPILEQHSKLKLNKDFKLGYSPERINPGDKERTVEKIVKVVAGSDPEALRSIAEVYGSIITAGIYQASSIKVAEAAKVIENIQRDLNIALMNELSIIFEKLGIDTKEVLEAAGTKWNFHKYTPGLVGGHCIGVDPYYLTYKAQQLGYHPEVILA
ncbi:MAG: nucleotide sugar dehydrogenase, partial [Candidatus Woesearchaeota archaeon]